MYLEYNGTPIAESGAADGVQLWSSTSGQTLQGDNLNDVFGAVSGDTIIGGSGDNQYYLYGPNINIVQGATGINTVTTWMDYTLPSNIQNLTVSGNGLYAAGNSLDNLITVGDTNQMTLYGAGGANVLVGGAGTDTFVVDSTAGSNAIYNWHSGDKIELLNTTISNFAQLQAEMTQQGSDVVFSNGQNNVVIRDATVSQFSASDFNLALDTSQLGGMTFDDEFNGLSLRSASNPNGVWDTNYGFDG